MPSRRATSSPPITTLSGADTQLGYPRTVPGSDRRRSVTSEQTIERGARRSDFGTKATTPSRSSWSPPAASTELEVTTTRGAHGRAASLLPSRTRPRPAASRRRALPGGGALQFRPPGGDGLRLAGHGEPGVGRILRRGRGRPRRRRSPARIRHPFDDRSALLGLFRRKAPQSRKKAHGAPFGGDAAGTSCRPRSTTRASRRPAGGELPAVRPRTSSRRPDSRTTRSGAPHDSDPPLRVRLLGGLMQTEIDYSACRKDQCRERLSALLRPGEPPPASGRARQEVATSRAHRRHARRGQGARPKVIIMHPTSQHTVQEEVRSKVDPRTTAICRCCSTRWATHQYTGSYSRAYSCDRIRASGRRDASAHASRGDAARCARLIHAGVYTAFLRDAPRSGHNKQKRDKRRALSRTRRTPSPTR